MKPEYKCGSCQKNLPSTTQFFYKSHLDRAKRNSNITALTKCISCCKVYQKQYSTKLKENNLTRKRTPYEEIEKTAGKLYIIGVKNGKKTPYKIGITSGTNISKRIIALQTSHWMELEVVFESPILSSIRSHERELHILYESKRIRGEWYNINQKDIGQIISKYK